MLFSGEVIIGFHLRESWSPHIGVEVLLLLARKVNGYLGVQSSKICPNLLHFPILIIRVPLIPNSVPSLAHKRLGEIVDL